jgi:hypothetical protein
MEMNREISPDESKIDCLIGLFCTYVLKGKIKVSPEILEVVKENLSKISSTRSLSALLPGFYKF